MTMMMTTMTMMTMMMIMEMMTMLMEMMMNTGNLQACNRTYSGLMTTMTMMMTTMTMMTMLMEMMMNRTYSGDNDVDDIPVCKEPSTRLMLYRP